MARRRIDMQKVKEARQKKIAIVGGVLLLAIVAFQAPRTMKLLNGADETAAAPPPATTVATTTAAATPVPAAAGGGGEAGRAPDAAPEPTGGQLVSFTRFASKDPFVQQIDRSAAAPASGGGGDARVSSEDEGAPVGPAPSAAAGGGVQPSAGSGAAPSAPATVRGTATIAVNDLEETVAVGGAFPTAAPLFRLVKLTGTTAQVAIAGGSYASGQATATLRLGRTLVLQNTADGTSYELRLVEVL